MTLSALMDEYRSCEAELYNAIGSEEVARIREFDIRMNWLRSTIREFDARSVTERLRQVEFFIAPLAQAADLTTDNPLFRDLRSVVERYATPVPIGKDEEGGLEQLQHNGVDPAELVIHRTPSVAAVAAIEKTNLRISVINREMRYTYASPANGRYYDMPPQRIVGRHLAEMIGADRFENRAKTYLEKCFDGEDQCYYYFLDSERHGHQLLECRMLHQHDSEADAPAAVLLLRDITHSVPDPVRIAEENRI